VRWKNVVTSQVQITKPVQGQSKEVDKKITEEENDLRRQAPFCHVRVEYSGRRPKKWKLDCATFPEL
jgi:stress response protein YsnF